MSAACSACGAHEGERCRTRSDDQCDTGKHVTQPVQQPAAVGINLDPAHLVALALSGALPDQQAGEILSAAYGKPAAVVGQEPIGYFRKFSDQGSWIQCHKADHGATAVYTAPVPAAGVQPDSGRDAALEEAAGALDILCYGAENGAGGTVAERLRQAQRTIRALAAHPAPSSDALRAFSDAVPVYTRDQVDHPNDTGRTNWRALDDDGVLSRCIAAALAAHPAPSSNAALVGVISGLKVWASTKSANLPPQYLIDRAEVLAALAAHPANGAQACDCDDGMRWVDGCTHPCEKCQDVTDDTAANGAQAGDAAIIGALADVLDEHDRNTCTHDSTTRGGAIWTICDFTDGGCGASGTYRETQVDAIAAWNRRAP